MNLSDIAQMRFRSMSAPDQYGIFALSDDGTFRIVPSEDFRDEMARLEEAALERSQKLGIGLGFGLLALGAAAIGIGWYLGRVFGQLGTTLSTPRPVSEVDVYRNDGGGLRVSMRGLESRLQTVQMAWNPDEFLQPEAESFIAKLNEMKAHGQPAKASQVETPNGNHVK